MACLALFFRAIPVIIARTRFGDDGRGIWSRQYERSPLTAAAERGGEDEQQYPEFCDSQEVLACHQRSRFSMAATR